MRARTADLRALEKMTKLVYRARLAAMVPLLVREASLRRLILELESGAIHDEAMSSVDLAMLAGADVRWRTWVAKRRRELEAELARNLAAQAKARSALRKAYGPQTALGALAKSSEKRDRATRMRRDLRDQ